MKKLIFFMLGSAMLATSAFAKDAKKQSAEKLAQTALSKGYIQKVNAVFKEQDETDGTLLGTNVLSTDAYVQAYNTSTSQTYYLTIHAWGSSGSNSITLPTGTYNISVSSGSTLADMYIADDDDWDSASSTYYHTFYSITINSSYTTVVSVE